VVEKSVIESINKFVDILRKEGIHIDKVILYGSHYRGHPREESDIDVAIVSRDFGKDSVEEGIKLFRLASAIDPRLEPLPVSLKSYKQDTWIPLIYEIRENGLEISKEVLATV